MATPGDLLFHIRAHRADLCFELAQRLVERLRGHAEVVDEVHGFKSFDERDLLGFVDGTENPVGAAAPAAALIGDEDPDFAGGSYVLVQRYLHDLTTWDALPVAEQERVVGRTKLNDIELADDVKPANSHVALTTIVDDDGEQHQILRYNMPFGRVGDGEFGTYFIGYARSPEVHRADAERTCSSAIRPATTTASSTSRPRSTGSLFFVPTRRASSRSTGPGRRSLAAELSSEPAGGPSDESLGIGSLK